MEVERDGVKGERDGVEGDRDGVKQCWGRGREECEERYD